MSWSKGGLAVCFLSFRAVGEESFERFRLKDPSARMRSVGVTSGRGSRALIAIFALALLGPSGCGFHPLYGKATPRTEVASAQMAQVRVAAIDDRKGQLLRNDLLERLTPRGEPARPLYTLQIQVSENMVGLGQQINSFATLGEMQMMVNFTLRDSLGRVVLTGAPMSTVSVNYLGPRYGSISVERDAEARALADIADDIRDRIGVYLRNPASHAKASQTTAPDQAQPMIQTPQVLQSQPFNQPLAP